MRSRQKKNKQKRTTGGEGLNFAITLITMITVFVFVGYLLGQYAVKLLQAQHNAQVRTVQSTPASSQPLPKPAVTSEPEAAAEQAPPPPSPAPQQTAVNSQGSSSSTLYRVQVGAFSSQANAERVVAQLKELGYEAIISSGPPYRVQTGAFSQRENAVRLSEELKKAGFEVAVVN